MEGKEPSVLAHLLLKKPKPTSRKSLRTGKNDLKKKFWKIL
jgi:hypothetical protein